MTKSTYERWVQPGYSERVVHHQLGRLFGPVALEESTLEGTLRLADEDLGSLMSVSSLNQRSAITAWDVVSFAVLTQPAGDRADGFCSDVEDVEHVEIGDLSGVPPGKTSFGENRP